MADTPAVRIPCARPLRAGVEERHLPTVRAQPAELLVRLVTPLQYAHLDQGQKQVVEAIPERVVSPDTPLLSLGKSPVNSPRADPSSYAATSQSVQSGRRSARLTRLRLRLAAA